MTKVNILVFCQLKNIQFLNCVVCTFSYNCSTDGENKWHWEIRQSQVDCPGYWKDGYQLFLFFTQKEEGMGKNMFLSVTLIMLHSNQVYSYFSWLSFCSSSSLQLFPVFGKESHKEHHNLGLKIKVKIYIIHQLHFQTQETFWLAFIFILIIKDINNINDNDWKIP